VVAHGSDLTVLSSERIDTPNVHGTGCSFASAIAAGLARGQEPLEALRSAKAFIDRGVRGGAAWRLGAGHGPIDHFGWESSP
jgi:hydroxymethylpyrimidine/phosphomethylpyrimidine kinase